MSVFQLISDWKFKENGTHFIEVKYKFSEFLIKNDFPIPVVVIDNKILIIEHILNIVSTDRTGLAVFEPLEATFLVKIMSCMAGEVNNDVC